MQLDSKHWTALHCVFHQHVSLHTKTITKTKIICKRNKKKLVKLKETKTKIAVKTELE